MRPTKNVAMSRLLTECHYRIFCLLNYGHPRDVDAVRDLLTRLGPHTHAFLSKPKRRKAVRK